MLDKIRECVATQIKRYCNIDDWKSVRYGYFIYSYLLFLKMVVSSSFKCDTLKELLEISSDIGLESKEILEYLAGVDGAEELIEMFQSDRKITIESTREMYQMYISNDFVIDGERNITFSKGKDSRDVLGAYYTSEKFANEITKKIINDYLSQRKKNINEITILDNSCGAGEFLIASIRNIREISKNIDVQKVSSNIYGFDVDPIAIIISRMRIMLEMNQKKVISHIVLGNPLILKENKTSDIEKFISVATGRFYCDAMSIGEELGQYDIIVGNPPWEKVRFEEKKFLKHYYVNEDIIESSVKRKQLIESNSKENKNYFKTIESDYIGFKKNIKRSKIFHLSSCGEINTYALFTELSLRMMNKDTVIGLIVKTSLLTMPVYKFFMKHLMNGNYLYDVFMFVNRNKIFNIDSREEFSVICLKNQKANKTKVALDLDNFDNFDSSRRITITSDILKLINPDTCMIPSVKNHRDMEFLIDLYSNNCVFGSVYNQVRYGRLVHFTNHAEHIIKRKDKGYIPIYEGKFIEQYNAKYATFRSIDDKEKYVGKASAVEIDIRNKDEYPESRFFINDEFWNNLSKKFFGEYIIAWRSLTSATNRRTMIATILPKIPTSQSLQILQSDDKCEMLNILALFNSIIFDYIIRLKMVGLDLTQTIVKQMPVPPKYKFKEEICFNGVDASIEKHIHSRMRLLYCNDRRMDKLFEKIDIYPIRLDTSKSELIKEIDIIVGNMYGIDKNRLKEIAKTFDKYYSEKEIEEWF